jgi:cytochrome o ubiquinol oxidase operon protein cyoD
MSGPMSSIKKSTIKKITKPADRERMGADEKTFLQYCLGFGLSIITTMLAYSLVNNHLMAGWGLAYTVVGLALLQVVIQLMFFLHLNQESEPRWNLMILDFTLLVVVIVVVGTLWVMQHLNYHGSPESTETYIVNDEGYQRQ